MTPDERDELIDLYADDALPQALQTRLETDPAAVCEAEANCGPVSLRLKDAPAERPDAWFAERALDRLLREHAQDTEQSIEQNIARTKQHYPFTPQENTH